jgi:hypothetical protein
MHPVLDDRAKPAIEIDCRARDVGGTRRQQERTNIPKLLSTTDATEGDTRVGDHPLVVSLRRNPSIGGIAFELLAFDHSAQNRIDTDALQRLGGGPPRTRRATQ